MLKRRQLIEIQVMDAASRLALNAKKPVRAIHAIGSAGDSRMDRRVL
jgi:hypothetical protein